MTQSSPKWLTCASTGSPTSTSDSSPSSEKSGYSLPTHAKGANFGVLFCTLERIGGTPSLLVGLLLVDPNAKSDQTLKTILHDQFRRALLAFPDEDVLLGARLTSADGYRAFTGLDDVVPRLGYRPTGEDRAWGRRLAKRFGSEKSIDDKTFVMTVRPGPVGGLDYVASKGPIPEGVDSFFKGLKPEKGQRLIVFGWAMAESLATGKLPK